MRKGAIEFAISIRTGPRVYDDAPPRPIRTKQRRREALGSKGMALPAIVGVRCEAHRAILDACARSPERAVCIAR